MVALCSAHNLDDWYLQNDYTSSFGKAASVKKIFYCNPFAYCVGLTCPTPKSGVCRSPIPEWSYVELKNKIFSFFFVLNKNSSTYFFCVQ